MSTSVRPEAAPGVPALPRALTYDEWQKADVLSPQGLRQANFPAAPPTPPAPDLRAQTDATTAGYQAPNPQAQKQTGLARILTQYVAEPVLEHPVISAFAPLIPGSGYLFAGMMGKDILEYSAQKAAELSLPAHERQLAEQDPYRIPGEQVAVEGALLGAGDVAHGAVSVAKDVASMGAENAAAIRMPGVAEKIRGHMATVNDAWNTIFSPADRSPEAAQVAGILRAKLGERAAQTEQAFFKLDQFRRSIDPLPEADKLDFMDAIEGGKAKASPLMEQTATAMKETLDARVATIQGWGEGYLEHLIQDYLPHIYTDPEKAGNAFEAAQATAAGKAPLEGGKSFLKQRSIPTIADAIEMGLEPISTNPVDLTLLKAHEMDRFIMAHDFWSEVKDAGLPRLVRSAEEMSQARRDGYTPVDDKIAKVFGPRQGAVTLPEGANISPEDVVVPGRRIMGEYWLPESASNVLNNYLSPGMRGHGDAIAKIFDAYRGIGNTLNQAQLGLSAFHLGFTSLDAVVSRNALGLEYLKSAITHRSGSDLATGLGKIMSSPAAPLPGLAQGLVGDPINYLSQKYTDSPTNIQIGLGAKLRDAYRNPEKATPDMLALMSALKESGGRISMDPIYRNSAAEKMIDRWRTGEYGKSVGYSIPAAIEMAAKPIMDHVVPLQKLQVFGELAQKALRDLPQEATLTERRAALQDVWDSVDNRMGQLVYDNLFWNKTFKDLAMASTRSLGWNIGTVREVGGGVRDLLTGEGLTHKAAYVISLPLTLGLYGALYQYLRTGEGPHELKDYFYPKTGEVDADGNPERVQLPSYAKDVYAYTGAPWQTVKHKANPLVETVIGALNNEDFYGDEIRNPNDPVVKQAAQEAAYIAKQVTPFSYRNMQESSQRGDQSATTKIGNWFGVTPAPRAVVRSDAQNMMADMLSSRPHGGATPEEVDARKSRAEILAGMRGNSNINLQDAVTNAIERHQLTAPDIVKLLKRAGTTPAQERFKRLTLVQAIDVFKASTDGEKKLFAEALMKKLERAGGP